MAPIAQGGVLGLDEGGGGGEGEGELEVKGPRHGGLSVCLTDRPLARPPVASAPAPAPALPMMDGFVSVCPCVVCGEVVGSQSQSHDQTEAAGWHCFSPRSRALSRQCLASSGRAVAQYAGPEMSTLPSSLSEWMLDADVWIGTSIPRRT